MEGNELHPGPGTLADPRRKEEWFKRLPPQAQQEVMDRWALEDQQGRIAGERRLADLKLLLIQVPVLLLVGSAVTFGDWGWILLTLPIPAVVIALFWTAIPGGRHTLGLLGGGIAQAWTLALHADLFTLFFGALYWVSLFTALAIGWESRRSFQGLTPTEARILSARARLPE